VLNSTQFGRLASLQDVANAAYFLCSDGNTGITGQFIKVDLGYSDVRII
jgi:enoyl-[acyl-carrier-protein] reductase (NADH)